VIERMLVVLEIYGETNKEATTQKVSLTEVCHKKLCGFPNDSLASRRLSNSLIRTCIPSVQHACNGR
jgi:hypothetical protein